MLIVPREDHHSFRCHYFHYFRRAVVLVVAANRALVAVTNTSINLGSLFYLHIMIARTFFVKGSSESESSSSSSERSDRRRESLSSSEAAGETASYAPWGGRENEAATPATKKLCFHGRHLRPAFPNRCAALSFLERSASVHANEPTQCAGVHVIALASCGPTHERAARLRRTLRPIMIQLLGSRAQSATCVLRAAQRRGASAAGGGRSPATSCGGIT